MRIYLVTIAFLALAACSNQTGAAPPETTAEADGEAAAPTDPAPTAIDEQPGGETPVEPAMTIEEMQARSLAEVDAAACAADGGEVRQEGMLGLYRCVRPYADAGKACRSGDDCAGKCLAPDGPMAGEDAEGRCQPTDSPFGCYAEVEDGKVIAAICVD